MQVTAFMIPPLITKYWRNLNNIAKTHWFKSSLMFTFFFSIVMAFAMLLIYRSAKQEIAEQIDTRLYAESNHLRRQLEERHRIELYPPMTHIIERVPGESAMTYCLMPLDPRHNHKEAPRDAIFFNSNSSNLCQLDFKHRLGESMRVIVRPLRHQYLLIAAYDISDELGILKRMRSTVYIATCSLLLLSFLGALYISSRLTRLMGNIRRTARRIMDGDFSRRIPTDDNDSDEMTLLAKELNHMLERIEALISSQRQVTNNIAHDLRSPLNRLRNRMEVSLLDRKSSVQQLRDVIADSIVDAENLLKTFNALLSIAQVESRARNDFLALSISKECEDLAELYEVLAEDGQHQFIADIAPDLQVWGNRHLLAQAITNLLDNAVKYTDQGGLICLQAWQHQHEVIIAVSDNGKGIPKEHHAAVLKRFVRLDGARSTPGNGLGLSLVSAIVELHNGRLSLHDNEPGLRVEIHLPILTC